jgi:hypothetical protein
MLYFTSLFFMIVNKITIETLDMLISIDDEKMEAKFMTVALYLGYTLGYLTIGMVVCNLRFWYSIFLILVYGSSVTVYIWKS